jgi:hypothetical protein
MAVAASSRAFMAPLLVEADRHDEDADEDRAQGDEDRPLDRVVGPK